MSSLTLALCTFCGWNCNLAAAIFKMTLTQAQKLRSLAIVSATAAGLAAGLSIYRGNEKFYEHVLMPATRYLPPEFSHQLAVWACKLRLFSGAAGADGACLRTEFLGKTLTNPIGIAAGFDKNGDAITGLGDIGFGFVEVGSVTPMPQEGNPKPRVFRLIEDKAIVNRYGFNSVGHETAFDRIQSQPHPNIVVGINLGKNKTSDDAAADYVSGIAKFAPIADYLVINVSSPNTPGLRNLQGQAELLNLLQQVLKSRDAQTPAIGRVPIALKLSPDLTDAELKDVVTVISRNDCRVDALIVSNTTLDRRGLKSDAAGETGGLSGSPLKDMSTKLVERVYVLTKGSVPIVGVGGVFTGRDAYEKILAGASVVQIYTSFAWHGPPVVARIKRELEQLLLENGYKSVNEAVGKGVTK